jgi:hypothetical protein
VPDEGKVSRRVLFEKALKKYSLEIEMPECDADYVLEYLFELGTTQGDAALTHTEIRAWMGNTGIELSSWEAQSIKRLSEIYLHCSFEYKKPNAETPWAEAPPYMSRKFLEETSTQESVHEYITDQ